MMTEETITAIHEKQNEVWEYALAQNLKAFEKYIRDHVDYNLVTDKKDFINSEIELIQDEISRNKIAYRDTYKKYKREIFNIPGSDYQNMKVSIAMGSTDEFKLNIPEEDQLNFKMHLAKGKMEFLKPELIKFSETGNQKQINPNLSFQDVLKPGIESQKVKDKYYEVFKNMLSKKSCLLYLRHLKDKGYYKNNELGWDQTYTIAENEFNISVSHSNKYTPPQKGTPEFNEQPWSKIPEAGKLLDHSI